MAEAETVAGPVIATLKERADGETRVALSPETAKKLTALGATVRVESGAGLNAAITDEAYREAGAEVGDLAEHAESRPREHDQGHCAHEEARGQGHGRLRQSVEEAQTPRHC